MTRNQRILSPDLNSSPARDIPLQFRKPLTLHLRVRRVEAASWLCVRSALHLRDTAITDGRTGLGAPHVKPSVRPSISRPIPRHLTCATKLYRPGPCLRPRERHICRAGPRAGIRALRHRLDFPRRAPPHFFGKESSMKSLFRGAFLRGVSASVLAFSLAACTANPQPLNRPGDVPAAFTAPSQQVRPGLAPGRLVGPIRRPRARAAAGNGPEGKSGYRPGRGPGAAGRGQ